jgi:hypothetical protein
MMACYEQDLLNAGVKGLREFGYPDASKDNILKPGILSKFFRAQLQDMETDSPALQASIDRLIAKIDENDAEPA